MKTVSASQAKLFEVIFRDADGVQLGDIESPLTTLTGTNAWNRYSDQYATPEDAVFMEVYGHQVGEGEVYLTPPQIEQGVSATAFDNGEISSGLEGYIIPVWDTSPVEYERHFGLPSGFSFAEVEIDDSDGFIYTVSYGSSDVDPIDDPPSGWTYLSDIEDVVFREWLAAKIEIEAP